MKQNQTAMAAAFAKAGMNASEVQLRSLAIDALKKHHRNIGRALPTFEAAVDDDPDLIREALFNYLCRLDTELLGTGQPAFGDQNSNAGAEQAHRNGEGHRNPANQGKNARPVREPSAEDVSAAGRVAQSVALTVFDSFKIRDGRPIGDVRFGELKRVMSENAIEAAVIRQILEHGDAPHDAKVRDILKTQQLQRMIQRAAEIVDAA